MTSTPAILGGDPVRPQGLPQWPVTDPAVQEVLARCAADGSWGHYHGPHCEQLTHALQNLLGVEHVILTCSGTAAVELALRGVGVNTESEVMLSAYDFKANFTNPLVLGARPVLVDCRAEDGQIETQRLRETWSGKTAALLVSHLHGACVDMRDVRQFADEKGLPVIEDICQMPGALVQERIAGTWGDVSVISFGGSKTLTAGRGGAVVTSRQEIAQRIRLYTRRGNEAYPLSEIQAALLVPQITSLESRRQQRSAAVAEIRARLGRFPFLQPFQVPEGCTPDYYKLGFFYDKEQLSGLDRERFCQAMRFEGIPVDSGFRALHKIHARSRYRSAGPLDNAGRLDDQVIVLHHPFLLTGPKAAGEFVLALDKISSHATLLLERL